MDDPLDTALTHVSTVYGLYVTQRQNVVNFYLAGVALLSVAYAAAIDKGQAPVAVAVCALGVLASAAAYLQDMRLRPSMRLAEKALRELQAQLAGKVGLDSVKIQAAIGDAEEKGAWNHRSARQSWSAGAKAIVTPNGVICARIRVADTAGRFPGHGDERVFKASARRGG